MKTALWVTSLQTANVDTLLANATRSRASIVCIRSTSEALPAAIQMFERHGIDVYSWRWPAVRKPKPGGAPHYYALDEAEYVVSTLIPAGLKGYIVDPESDGPGQVNDCNSADHAELAERFCDTIKQGASGKPFHFGVTSGCQYPTNHAQIPWKVFVDAADALYPQTYWRAEGKNGCVTVHGDTPAESYRRGMASWQTIAAGRPLVAIAGELDCIGSEHVGEIAEFGALVKGEQDIAHFFSDSVGTPSEVHEAIGALVT